MFRYIGILILIAAVVALPFVLRPAREDGDWREGDPVLTIVTPHNEAIRYEFARGFSEWHRRLYGQPVKIDWRNIGGTTEIMRYLGSQYAASFRAWWVRAGRPWHEGAAEAVFGPDPGSIPPDGIRGNAEKTRRWEAERALWRAFRETDDPSAFGSGMDLFFGGGTYDHGKAARQGFCVEPWPPAQPPADTLFSEQSAVLIPEKMGGEVWRTPIYFGTVLSTFGICYNVDCLKELGIAQEPRQWEDLAGPRYFGKVGVADPTKSGSIAKAFEMIVHEQCRNAVVQAGFDSARVAEFERQITAARLPPGEMPAGVPVEYQAAVERGWLQGMRLVQKIGANARYFTDSASKVPIDVGLGDVAAGLTIDFYGRFQSETIEKGGGGRRMRYITPAGGSSVSADPISLLRGAAHRELALRFLRFVLSEDGQRLWTYAPGTAGGPHKFALRRLPIRRDFYPSEDPRLQAQHLRHAACAVDALGDPAVNPYALAGAFTYYPRWTGAHFGVQRDLIRAMCLDSGEELRAAWRAILDAGDPKVRADALALLERMPLAPEPLTWRSAPDMARRYDRRTMLREWTLCFRDSYRQARQCAQRGGSNGGPLP